MGCSWLWCGRGSGCGSRGWRDCNGLEEAMRVDPELTAAAVNDPAAFASFVADLNRQGLGPNPSS
jgi:hypothetical protein